MRIAFLGTGRMGTELALRLLGDHDLVVWNRTKRRTEPLVDAGASVADTPQDAVRGCDVVITALFGPDTVREVVIEPELVPSGTPWLDTTTVGPRDAEEFAQSVPSYVATPVVGTLGPARAGRLGVYVGTPDQALRELATNLVRPWADPERLRPVESAAKAAAGKLMANLALAVSAQGLREALALGSALQVPADDVLTMLKGTGLDFMATMKAPFVRGERSVEQGDFTVDALAKDIGLMLDCIEGERAEARTVLPALAAALDSFDAEKAEGHGSYDLSAIDVDHP